MINGKNGAFRTNFLKNFPAVRKKKTSSQKKGGGPPFNAVFDVSNICSRRVLSISHCVLKISQ